ncbi:MAG: AbrB/MazE/SpoVT family DNA-binding domain-containing protein [Rhizomicrobium sp.]
MRVTSKGQVTIPAHLREKVFCRIPKLSRPDEPPWSEAR